MNAELLGVVALALILVCLWIWMNILLTKPKRDAQVHPPAVDTAVPTAPSPQASAQPGSLQDSGSVEQTDAMTSALERAQDDSTRDLEVVAQSSRRSRKVFDQTQEHPFLVNLFAAPRFEEQNWLECFYKLTEDPSVLGWIAFAENSVGASDRDYDDDFVDVLRTYKHSVEKLRRQVGLSTVLETSVVGEEGKVWFVTPVEDTWLALFVDKEADVEQLTVGLLAPVR